MLSFDMLAGKIAMLAKGNVRKKASWCFIVRSGRCQSVLVGFICGKEMTKRLCGKSSGSAEQENYRLMVTRR